MNIDYYLKRGPLHAYCQDYVAYKTNKLVLCDGCSAAENAEVGASLLAHATLENKQCNLLKSVKLLNLPESCLYATLLELDINEEKKEALFTRYGDGFLAVCTDKALFLDEFKYKVNAPFYLAYKLLELETNWFNLSNRLIRYGYKFNSNLELEEKTECLFLEYLSPYEEKTKLSLKDVKWIAVCSDGLDSFIDENGESVPLQEVVKEVFSFKNFHNGFVQRRMNNAFKTFEKRKWKHYDDFSIGVINLC